MNEAEAVSREPHLLPNRPIRRCYCIVWHRETVCLDEVDYSIQ
jgi:hypothetical protein